MIGTVATLIGYRRARRTPARYWYGSAIKVATLIGYRRAPRATFVVKHPVKTVRLLKLRRDLSHRLSRRRLAVGLGAVAVALPLGLWISNRVRS